MPGLERIELREVESGWWIVSIFEDGSEQFHHRVLTRSESESAVGRLNRVLARMDGSHVVIVPAPGSLDHRPPET